MFAPFNKQPKRLAKLADSEEAMHLMGQTEDKRTGYGQVLEAVTSLVDNEYYEFVEGLNLTREQFCRLNTLTLGRIIDYGRAMLIVGMLVQAQFGAAKSKRPVDDVERVVNQIGQPSKDEQLLEDIFLCWNELSPEQQAEIGKKAEELFAKESVKRMIAVSQSRDLFEPNQPPQFIESHPN